MILNARWISSLHSAGFAVTNIILPDPVNLLKKLVSSTRLSAFKLSFSKVDSESIKITSGSNNFLQVSNPSRNVLFGRVSASVTSVEMKKNFPAIRYFRISYPTEAVCLRKLFMVNCVETYEHVFSFFNKLKQNR